MQSSIAYNQYLFIYIHQITSIIISKIMRLHSYNIFKLLIISILILSSSQQCLARQYLDLTTNTCLLCDTSCNTCIDFSNCTTCIQGSYLERNGICFQCEQGCYTCINFTNCISCISTFYYFDDTTNKCQPCSQACQFCKNSRTCQNCLVSFYYDNQTNICYKCDWSCFTCNNNFSCLRCLYDLSFNVSEHSGLCSDCAINQGYYVNSDNNTCLRCDLNCDTCTMKGCTRCTDGYSINSTFKCEKTIKKQQLPSNIYIAISLSSTVGFMIISIAVYYYIRRRLNTIQNRIIPSRTISQRQINFSHVTLENSGNKSIDVIDLNRKVEIKLDESCSICLQNNCDVITICNHIFHCQCLKGWVNVNGNCPDCRREKLGIVKVLLCDKCNKYVFGNIQTNDFIMNVKYNKKGGHVCIKEQTIYGKTNV